jgi:hypothetical protein
MKPHQATPFVFPMFLSVITVLTQVPLCWLSLLPCILILLVGTCSSPDWSSRRQMVTLLLRADANGGLQIALVSARLHSVALILISGVCLFGRDTTLYCIQAASRGLCHPAHLVQPQTGFWDGWLVTGSEDV